MNRALASRVMAVLLALGLATGACAPGDPEARFTAAFEATLADSFAFTVLLEADQAALADLGESAGGAAALLSGIRLTGVVDGDDTSLHVEALGGSIVEVRQIGAGGDPAAAFYVRAGVVDLLAQVGIDEFDAETTVLAQMRQQNASQEVVDVIEAGFDGAWVGIAGGLGSSLGEAAGGPDTAEEVRSAFGASAADFLDRYVEVTEFDDGVLRTGLRLGELLRAASGVGDSLPLGPDFVPEDLETDLANLPEVVAGDVRIADGRVEEFAFDVAQAARAFGRTIDGQIVVRVQLSSHGTAGPVKAPPGVTPLASDVLDEAIAAILATFGVG
ncbi:MAG: hypothetical protein ACI867_000091 [Glaciecola sp.]